MSRGFQRPAARPCAGGGAATPGCDPAVCGAQKRRHTGKLRERNQGPGPPDTRREEDDRVGAAIALPFRGENAHFAEQFLLGHAEQSRDPPVLKRSEGKATGHEDAGHAAGESDAEGAFGVKEEPAGAGASSLAIGHFRAKRNHGPQKTGAGPFLLHDLPRIFRNFPLIWPRIWPRIFTSPFSAPGGMRKTSS